MSVCEAMSRNQAMTHLYPDIQEADAGFLVGCYPSHVPVVVDKVDDTATAASLGFLVLSSQSVRDFRDVILTNFESETPSSVFWLLSGMDYISEDLEMKEVYNKYKGVDRLLHLHIFRLDHVKKRNDFLWERRLFADAVVACKGDGEGAFEVHTAILASVSRVFSALFQAKELQKGTHYRLEIQARRVEVEAMLRFIYMCSSDHLIRLESTTLGKVLELAQMFELHGLIESSCAFLVKALDSTSVAECARALQFYRGHPLVQTHWNDFCNEVANNPDLVKVLLDTYSPRHGMLGAVYEKHKQLFIASVVGDVEIVGSMIVAESSNDILGKEEDGNTQHVAAAASCQGMVTCQSIYIAADTRVSIPLGDQTSSLEGDDIDESSDEEYRLSPSPPRPSKRRRLT